jgi:hypothetical protein
MPNAAIKRKRIVFIMWKNGQESSQSQEVGSASKRRKTEGSPAVAL